MPRLMTEHEASEYLSVSVATLRRWRREKKGPVVTKPGGIMVRYDVGDLEKFIDSSKPHETAENEATNGERTTQA